MFKDSKMDINGGDNSLDTKVAKEIFNELEAYLNKPIEEICQEYWSRKEAEEKENQNRITKTEDRKEILDNYKTTNQFLYT